METILESTTVRKNKGPNVQSQRVARGVAAFVRGESARRDIGLRGGVRRHVSIDVLAPRC
jgi:hypothetical protein